MAVAISGFNVFLALFLGIFVAGSIGIYYSDVTFYCWLKKSMKDF